jgi:hypothetical protein
LLGFARWNFWKLNKILLDGWVYRHFGFTYLACPCFIFTRVFILNVSMWLPKVWVVNNIISYPFWCQKTRLFLLQPCTSTPV